MAEKIDFGYMEFLARVDEFNFGAVPLEEMVSAVEQSSVHTFGWPIVFVNRGYEPHGPKPIPGGVEAKFLDKGHRDYWVVKRNSEMYYIGELFENNRDARKIFLDTRTNRVTEVFMRVHKYYDLMGVPGEKQIDLMIRHGNIKGRMLGAGNPMRIFPIERKCSVNEVTSNFSAPLKDLASPSVVQELVFQAIRDLAEMFELFHPDKAQFTDPIVHAYLLGKII